MINPYMILGGIVAIAGTFGTGLKVGSMYQSGRCDAKLLTQLETNSTVLFRKDERIQKCEAQVGKINETVAQQGKELAAKISADARSRQQAQDAAAERDADLAIAQQRVRDALAELKGKLDETDFGECAGTTVPDDLNRLFNEFLATPEGSSGP